VAEELSAVERFQSAVLRVLREIGIPPRVEPQGK